MSATKIAKPAFLAAALAVALSAGGIAAQSDIGPISSVCAEETVQVALPDFSKLVEDNGKAVVFISTVKKARTIESPHGQIPQEQLEMLRRFGFPFPFDDFHPRRSPERRGQGSGFIISADGLILTNHHVVDGADKVKVRLTDDREFKARVLGSDAKTDVAVLKIDADRLPTVKIGNSDKVKVGEWVAAIGAPFGLDNTVTAGIVSAKSRNLPDDQFVPFIQTDVAVNPGNSGGPLFNMKGEVIGINSQIFSTSGGFMGLSFAIPIDLAVKIKDQLVKDGKISRGRVGIMIQTLTPEIADSLGLKNQKGALIAQIEKDGPADKAGLNEGDLIIEFNGKPVNEARDLSFVVADTKPGTTVKVKVLREGNEKTLNITVDELKDASSAAAPQKAAEKSRLGVTVRPLNDAEKKRVSYGIAVESSSGAAAEAGIRKGDIIISAGGKRINSFEDLQQALDKAKDSIAILVDRNGGRTFIPVKLAQKESK